jgi:hypothetical protein
MTVSADRTDRRVSAGQPDHPDLPVLRRGRRDLDLGRRLTKQLTAPRQVPLPVAIRQQAEVPNPDEAFG